MYQICRDFKANCGILLKKLRGYKKAEIYGSLLKAFDRNKEDLLTQNNEPKYRIPLSLGYNHTLQNVKKQ